MAPLLSLSIVDRGRIDEVQDSRYIGLMQKVSCHPCVEAKDEIVTGEIAVYPLLNFTEVVVIRLQGVAGWDTLHGVELEPKRVERKTVYIPK